MVVTFRITNHARVAWIEIAGSVGPAMSQPPMTYGSASAPAPLTIPFADVKAASESITIGPRDAFARTGDETGRKAAAARTIARPMSERRDVAPLHRMHVHHGPWSTSALPSC